MRVKHRHVRSGKIVSAHGEFYVDDKGHVDIPDHLGSTFLRNYGGTFEQVFEPSDAKVREAARALAVEEMAKPDLARDPDQDADYITRPVDMGEPALDDVEIEPEPEPVEELELVEPVVEEDESTENSDLDPEVEDEATGTPPPPSLSGSGFAAAVKQAAEKKKKGKKKRKGSK